MDGNRRKLCFVMVQQCRAAEQDHAGHEASPSKPSKPSNPPTTCLARGLRCLTTLVAEKAVFVSDLFIFPSCVCMFTYVLHCFAIIDNHILFLQALGALF